MALLLALWVGAAVPAAHAKVFYTQNEALELAFPDADRVEKDVRVLDEVQRSEIERRARSKLDSRIVKLFQGYRGETLLGYAVIDVHSVRTLSEALLVVLTPQGDVRSLHTLAFHEPLDYLPPQRWYEQFQGKNAADSLRVGRDLHGILGSTLSARAVSDSVRRVLAYYEVLVRSGD